MRRFAGSALFICLCVVSSTLQSQDTAKTFPNGTDGLVFRVNPLDTVLVNKKSQLAPNEFEGTYTTLRIGFGYIGDFTSYAQDAVFKRQMDSLGVSLASAYKTRDFRILGSGRLLKSKRYVGFKFAYMYDGDKKVWMIRETGLTIGMPELAGNIFIGRTKEGFSMVKVMNGHSLWGYERPMVLDPIPILADGIKWFGYLPGPRVLWNLGYYNDFLSKGQSFSTFHTQLVARVGWMPIHDSKKGHVLHIAANIQYGKPVDGQFTMKSRPESNPTPQLINTGQFPADKATSVGGEIWYNYKSLLVGGEIITHHFYSGDNTNHTFTGGYGTIGYFFTGTRRPYNTAGSIFGFTEFKRKSVFKGGTGEIEGVVTFSTFDLNDRNITGGSMWRLTPMVNWYLTKTLRWEFIYGYGELDRFGLKGHVQFFESRIQLTVM